VYNENKGQKLNNQKVKREKEVKKLREQGEKEPCRRFLSHRANRANREISGKEKGPNLILSAWSTLC